MQKEGKKNDKKDDKTRWELMPLDCLEDIARVYTEGAKKYGDNTWQYLDNGYQRYKGALLRHLYRSENETFDEETGCRHLAQVAWNAIALLWLSKAEEPDLIDKFSSNVFGGIKNEEVFNSSFGDSQFFYEQKTSTSLPDNNIQDTCGSRANESNEELEDLFHEFIKEEEICTYNHDNRREAGQNSVESRSDVDVPQQILKESSKSQFLEDYSANLAAQATEIILGHKIVRK